jgi:hypothetical protein
MWVDCRHCENCIVLKRETKQTRLLMEAQSHAEACFITATLRPDPNIPDHLRSLDKRECQHWLKRLRWHADERQPGTRLRIFYIGEYGPNNTQRPHYHAAIYGIGCRPGFSQMKPGGGFDCICSTCQMVRKSWPLGIIQIKQFGPAAAQYMTKYMSQKAERNKDEFLKGRAPEFAHGSNRPGLGALYVDELAKTFLEMERLQATRPPRWQRDYPDVPAAIPISGGRNLKRIGTYLQRKFRVAVGRPQNAPQSTLDIVKRKTRALQTIARHKTGGKPYISKRTGELTHTNAGEEQDLMRTMFRAIGEPKARKSRAKQMLYRGKR